MPNRVIPIGAARRAGDIAKPSPPPPAPDPPSVGLHPLINYHMIGSRTESLQWTLLEWLDRVAFAHQIQFNFAPVDVSNGSAAAAIQHVLAANPTCRTSSYLTAQGFLQSSASQLAHQQFVEDNYTTPKIPGTPGVTVNGMSWDITGTVINSGWPNKLDLNPTTWAVRNDPNAPIPLHPYVYYSIEQWEELFTLDPTLAGLMHEQYWDIWRVFPRFEDEGDNADWRRDFVGNAYPTDWDMTTDELATRMLRAKAITYDEIQLLSQALLGRGMPFLGNWGSLFDWFDGAPAHTDRLTIAKQPYEFANQQGRRMNEFTDGGMIENLSKIMGFNPNGTFRGNATINYERAHKLCQRFRKWTQISPFTGTKRTWGHIDLEQQLYNEAAYCCGILTMQGLYSDLSWNLQHKDPGIIDEFIGEDIAPLSWSERIAKRGWLGQAEGEFGDFNDTYIDGVRGGIWQNNVRFQRYENGGILLNPENNGSQNITSLPPGNWRRIAGGQNPTWNNGQLLQPSVSNPFNIPAKRTIWLRKE